MRSGHATRAGADAEKASQYRIDPHVLTAGARAYWRRATKKRICVQRKSSFMQLEEEDALRDGQEDGETRCQPLNRKIITNMTFEV